nr:hypothetical protein [Tanacetum cinerariifolium]
NPTKEGAGDVDEAAR